MGTYHYKGFHTTQSGLNDNDGCASTPIKKDIIPNVPVEKLKPLGEGISAIDKSRSSNWIVTLIKKLISYILIMADIKEELEKLKQSRSEIYRRMLEDKDKITKLNSTIKQLERLSGKVSELIEDSPVIEQSSLETLKEVSKNLV